MFHRNGWCTAWALTAIGGRQVCLRAVQPERIWQLLEQEKVTHLNGAPAVLTALLGAEEAHELEPSLVITTAGAPPNPKMIAQCEDINARFVHVYGLTETYGPYSVCQWQEDWKGLKVPARAERLSRQGVGMVQAERLRVVDDEMNDVPSDGETLGEIVMRGNNVMKGYFEHEEGTDAAFKGGWFHSGDLRGPGKRRLCAAHGSRQGRGYIRWREHLHSRGRAGPGRPRCGGRSGGDRGARREVGWAAESVRGARARSRRQRESDIDHVRSRIAHYKAPKEVVFMDALPTTSTGKVVKFELRASEAATRDSAGRAAAAAAG